MLKRGKIITIGSFDGIHLGHKELIAKTVLEAKRRQYKSLALTFQVPPKMILDRQVHSQLLTSPAEKEALLKHLGIDQVVSLNFNKSLSKLKPFEFFKDLLLKDLKAKGIVVGWDFRFGVNRSAGARELVRWGLDFELPVWVVPPVRKGNIVISSTLIRDALNVNYSKGLKLMGHPCFISGLVVKGNGVGRKIGTPTANFEIYPGKVMPRGVFAVKAFFHSSVARWPKKKKWFEGVCNIGTRPTIHKKSKVVVEAHFFNTRKEFSGHFGTLFLIKKIRDEEKFKNVKKLKSAIKIDIKKSHIFLKKTKKTV